MKVVGVSICCKRLGIQIVRADARKPLSQLGSRFPLICFVVWVWLSKDKPFLTNKVPASPSKRRSKKGRYRGLVQGDGRVVDHAV